MRHILIAAGFSGIIACGTHASDFWHFGSSSTLSFEKAPWSDATDPANWDTITSNVAIARGASQGLFNPLVETSYTGGGPSGTLWFFGGTAQDVADGTVDASDFNIWQTAAANNPPATVGMDAVLYLVAEDTYIDIKFTGWGIGPGSGAGFSYDRATPAPGVLGVFGVAGLGVVRRRR